MPDGVPTVPCHPVWWLLLSHLAQEAAGGPGSARQTGGMPGRFPQTSAVEGRGLHALTEFSVWPVQVASRLQCSDLVTYMLGLGTVWPLSLSSLPTLWAPHP